MSLITKAYLFILISLGFASLALQLREFHTEDPFRLIAYLVLALLASSMKVRLPGVSGTMSVLLVFLLIGIIDLTLPETLLIGVAAAWVQSFWLANKPRKFIHVSFNMASTIIAIMAAHLAYTSPAISNTVPVAWRVVAAACVYFVGNTLTVAVIIALTENKPIIETWRTNYFWSFPYYIVGACVAGLFSYLARLVGWQTSVLTLPVIYLIYRSYRLYFERLEESRSHAEEIRAAANRLNNVLESTSDCVIAISDGGIVTYTNHRARTRLFRDTDPVGTVLWDRFPKLATSGFRDHVQKTMEVKAPLSSEEFFPELNAWFAVNAYPSAEGFALYLKEITEQRELTEKLRQAQKMEAIGRLAGGVAHDFNNLLTIILGYGESAIEMLPKDHPAWSSITEVLRAGERAAGLTQRLLAFSRKQVVQPEVLDLNAIVFGMEEMLRRLIGEDVQIAVNLDPTIGRIRADQNQVEQVVMNLAVNARDAMPDGGQLRISTYPLVLDSADAAHDPSAPQLYAVLSITDTGFGMDAETQAQIFEPFFTTKEKGKGTGLGLSTVYGIVQQSRGFITVRSEPGQGSTFSVHLPCTAEDQKPADTSEFDGQPAGSGRILLVEDEAAVRELTRRMLVDSGYAVIVSSDAGDALRLRKSELEGVDLLLTDVVMPGLSGPELAEHLVKRQPGLKVLYVSGYTDHPIIGQQGLSDRESFLQKPFTQAQLLKTVQRVMRRG